MAVKVCTASGTLSTTATWARAEDFNLSVNKSSSDINGGSILYLPLTYTTACNATGLVVDLYKKYTQTLNMEVTLQEYVGSVWTDRVTTTFTDNVTDTNEWERVIHIEHTPYAVDTAADKWRYKIACGSTEYNHFLYGDGGTNPSFAAVGDADTSKPTASDAIVIPYGVTLTVDESLTLVAYDRVSMMLGGLLLVDQPAAPYTMTLAGGIQANKSLKLQIGTAANPITTENRFTIVLQESTTNAALFYQKNETTPAISFFNNDGYVKFYGTEDNYLNTRVAATASSGQAIITTTADMSAQWGAGDILYFTSRKRAGFQNSSWVISSINGTSITLTTNLTEDVLVGGSIINYSRKDNLAIHIIQNNSIAFSMAKGTSGEQYRHVKDFHMTGTYVEGFRNFDMGTCLESQSMIFRSILSFRPAATGGGFTNMFQRQYGNKNPDTLENIHCVCEGSGYNGLKFEGHNSTIKNFTGFALAGYNQPNIAGYANKITGLVFGQSYNGGYDNMKHGAFTGAGHIVNDVVATGEGGMYINCSASTFNNISVALAKTVSLTIGGAVDTYINNADLGSLGATGSYSLASRESYTSGVDTVALLKVWLNNCTFSDPLDEDSFINNSVDTGYIRISNFDEVAGDHIGRTLFGSFYSATGRLFMRPNGNGLCHTEYNVFLNSVTSTRFAVLVDCEIQSANYYGGTHSLPKLVVNYDNGLSVEDQAAASVSTQKLICKFSPSVSSNMMEIVLEANSDAAVAADTDVSWAAVTIRSRRYGYQFGETTKNVTEILSNLLADIETAETDPFITVTTEATVAAYTGISINHATGLVTVTEDHTIQELYDYCKYNLSLEANLGYGDFFSTIDGITYDCSYDLTVDGAALSGAGKTLDLGANTFTAANGGSFSGIVTDASGTLVSVVLDGVVVGSRCYVAKQSDGTVILDTVATSTEVSAGFQHSTNTLVDIVVRKATSGTKYLPYKATGIITATGLYAIISQVPDTILN